MSVRYFHGKNAVSVLLQAFGAVMQRAGIQKIDLTFEQVFGEDRRMTTEMPRVSVDVTDHNNIDGTFSVKGDEMFSIAIEYPILEAAKTMPVGEAKPEPLFRMEAVVERGGLPSIQTHSKTPLRGDDGFNEVRDAMIAVRDSMTRMIDDGPTQCPHAPKPPHAGYKGITEATLAEAIFDAFDIEADDKLFDRSAWRELDRARHEANIDGRFNVAELAKEILAALQRNGAIPPQ